MELYLGSKKVNFMSLPDFFTAGVTPLHGRVLAKAVAANAQVVQPAGTTLRRIFVRNNTANAVTGGIRVGVAAAGVSVHAAIAVAASDIVSVAPLFGAYTAVARPLFFEAVTAWNSASVDIVVEFDDVT